MIKTAKIVKRKAGYHVVSKAGKNLGGPYKSRDAAVKRLQQVEYFKNKGKKGSYMSNAHEKFARAFVGSRMAAACAEAMTTEVHEETDLQKAAAGAFTTALHKQAGMVTIPVTAGSLMAGKAIAGITGALSAAGLAGIGLGGKKIMEKGLDTALKLEKLKRMEKVMRIAKPAVFGGAAALGGAAASKLLDGDRAPLTVLK
jgi:hypothetical protein